MRGWALSRPLHHSVRPPCVGADAIQLHPNIRRANECADLGHGFLDDPRDGDSINDRQQITLVWVVSHADTHLPSVQNPCVPQL